MDIRAFFLPRLDCCFYSEADRKFGHVVVRHDRSAALSTDEPTVVDMRAHGFKGTEVNVLTLARGWIVLNPCGEIVDLPDLASMEDGGCQGAYVHPLRTRQGLAHWIIQ
jgi:hypothetical protein